jgi:hypothetical protein
MTPRHPAWGRGSATVTALRGQVLPHDRRDTVSRATSFPLHGIPDVTYTARTTQFSRSGAGATLASATP